MNRFSVCHSSKQEQDHPRKTVCRYFGSARGCFLGDKCMFLHPGRGVSVPEESSSISGGIFVFLLSKH